MSCRWPSCSWASVTRQCDRRWIVLDDGSVRIREVAARWSFRGGVQIDRRCTDRRVWIKRLRRDQQTAIKRAELLTFIGERTVTLGATLHLGGPLKRD